ncbi:MAG TPA: serine/threonine-protein kinase [Enhygromyxa sp.]|nr:serine/threonine-protein kinase [Enhygromyxa sp.]
MSGEPIESADLAELGSDRIVDPVERVQARKRAHAALFGDSTVSGPHPIRVDRYELMGKAGSGGLGTVWKAYDPKLDREVAIKLLRPDKLRAGQRARAQLMAEAAVMARLTHPNVVRVYDIGEARVELGTSEPDSQLYVAMEFVDGQTLRRWQRQQQRSLDELLEVYSQAAAGLLAAHEAQLVHGDFKPDNVLIDQRGRVLVTDFAVTRNMVRERVEYELSTLQSPTESERNNRVRESIAAVMIGTPAYMSPEQLDGEVPDARSDQFGFCVALWEAVTGERPFPGRTFAALREAIAAGPPPFPASVRPTRLRSVLVRGLAEDPRDRYPDLQALLDELRRPEQTRPRGLAIAGASLLAVLGGLLVVPQLLAVEPERAPEPEPEPVVIADQQSCADQAERTIAEVWTPAQIEALRRHWQDVAVAASASAQAEARLDAWHRSWLAASQNACEAHRAQTLGDESYQLLEVCLARSLQSYAVLLGLLATADHDALTHINSGLAALPVLDSCSDPQHAAQITAKPSFADPEQAQALLDAGESLVRAEYLVLLHELDDALSLVEPLLGVSESLGWDAGRARALSLRGSVRVVQGDLEAGENDLSEATVAARRAGRPDIEANALIERGFVRLDRGDAREALADFQAAAATDEALLPPDHCDRIRVELGLALAELALERPGAREALERLLERLDDHGSPDPELRARISAALQ